jgi:hypothetical protein
VGAGFQPAQEAEPGPTIRRLKTCGHFQNLRPLSEAAATVGVYGHASTPQHRTIPIADAIGLPDSRMPVASIRRRGMGSPERRHHPDDPQVEKWVQVFNLHKKQSRGRPSAG